LYYQPVVDQAGTVTGVEALLRWLHPFRGMVSPAVFIPVAEQTGLDSSAGPMGAGGGVCAVGCLERRLADPKAQYCGQCERRQFRHPDFSTHIWICCAPAVPIRIA